MQEEKWSLLITVRMQNRFAHCCRQWAGRSLKSSKGILNVAGAWWDSGEEQTGGEMCPLRWSRPWTECQYSFPQESTACTWEGFIGNLTCLFLSTVWRFFLLFLLQAAIELRLESRAMAAPREPHFMGTSLYGTASPLIALIGKAHSFKDFHYIFITISINITLLPQLFFF